MDALILGVHGLLPCRSALDPRDSGPRPEAAPQVRSILRRLSRNIPVVLLERGPADPLEAWALASGLADLAAFRLWSERLGRQARPPSRLPFRFIQRRLQTSPDQMLYIGCDDGTLAAARRAGCRTWDVRRDNGECLPEDLVDLVRWLQETASGPGGDTTPPSTQR